MGVVGRDSETVEDRRASGIYDVVSESDKLIHKLNHWKISANSGWRFKLSKIFKIRTVAMLIMRGRVMTVNCR